MTVLARKAIQRRRIPSVLRYEFATNRCFSNSDSALMKADGARYGKVAKEANLRAE